MHSRPIVAEKLKQAGHDAVHVRELGMQSAPDYEIFEEAENQERTLISADTDFGALLSLRDKCKPSFILIRKNTGTQPTATVAKAARRHREGCCHYDHRYKGENTSAPHKVNLAE